ncbi:MAG: ribonuclease P protein component [Clostridia bacterium]|nr:ribonuclease P protein component [Clostridia bacterium]
MKNIAISEDHLFRKVYAKGQKVFCKHIAVYVLTDYRASRLARENPLKTRVNRVGLTVTKKLGKAVVRTRTRRILRAAYQQLEKENNIKKGFLVVIVARDAATEAKTQDIYRDLLYAAKKLGLVIRDTAENA